MVFAQHAIIMQAYDLKAGLVRPLTSRRIAALGRSGVSPFQASVEEIIEEAERG